MTDDLLGELKAGFKRVDDQFVAFRVEVQAGFKRVDDEFVAVRVEMQTGFKRVDDEFVAVRVETQTGFKRVDDEFVAVRTEVQALRTELRAEGETTRRHFDIVAEQFKEYVRVLADGTARHTERLDDHDKRLTALEQPRG
jgi:hypothetical protein